MGTGSVCVLGFRLQVEFGGALNGSSTLVRQIPETMSPQSRRHSHSLGAGMNSSEQCRRQSELFQVEHVLPAEMDRTSTWVKGHPGHKIGSRILSLFN